MRSSRAALISAPDFALPRLVASRIPNSSPVLALWTRPICDRSSPPGTLWVDTTARNRLVPRICVRIERDTAVPVTPVSAVSLQQRGGYIEEK